jgi:hypothetical protein
MVTQRGDDPAELCLHVANSDPPWCSWSVEVDNWSWDAVDDSRVEVNGPDPTDTTRWGFYFAPDTTRRSVRSGTAPCVSPRAVWRWPSSTAATARTVSAWSPL